MARAYIAIDDDLKRFVRSAFGESERAKSRSDTTFTRWIKSELKDGEIPCFGLGSHGLASNDNQMDFDSMISTALGNASGPCFVMYRPDVSLANAPWVLIMFVPECSHVRKKMLLASSADDFMSDLGESSFLGRLFVSSIEELNLTAVHGFLRSMDDSLPLTEIEVETAEQLMSELSSFSKEYGSPGVPFAFVGELLSSLEELDDLAENEVFEILINANEEVELGRRFGISGLLNGMITESEPRFFIVRMADTNRNFFVFWSPSSAGVKARMIYSTAKQAVISKLAEMKIILEKTIEATDLANLEEAVESMKTVENAGGEMKFLTNQRPKRPARGPRKLLSGVLTK